MFPKASLSAAVLLAFIGFGVNAHTLAARKDTGSSSNSTSNSTGSDGGTFTNAQFTFYDVGLGACGKTNQPDDPIVALNSQQYGGGSPGPNCFKKIHITYKGKGVDATIMDECPGCPFGGLDLSRGLFDQLASEDVGVIYGSWSFTGETDPDGKSGNTNSTASTGNSDNDPPNSGSDCDDAPDGQENCSNDDDSTTSTGFSASSEQTPLPTSSSKRHHEE